MLAAEDTEGVSYAWDPAGKCWTNEGRGAVQYACS